MVLKLKPSPFLCPVVLDPYKLTWFSNLIDEIDIAKKVLDPYKLTWFSNSHTSTKTATIVLDPYKLTWFSNYMAV